MWALILLGTGGIFLPLVGWTVGAWLLWGSPVWSRKEKLIGTLATVGLAPGAWLYLQLAITPSDDTPSTSELVFQWGWTLMVFVGLGAITYLAVRLRRRSKLAARLVPVHSGQKKDRIMNTPVLLLSLLALGLLASGVLNLVRGDDGESEASMKEDVTKVGNDWAPLFAKDALAACDFMYTPSSPPGPLCVEFFRKIGPRRPSQFQKSFANATVERVAIIDYDAHRAEGTRALAEFSNGELVEFLQTLSPGGNPERSRSVGWFISDLGPTGGKKYKAEAAGLSE